MLTYEQIERRLRIISNTLEEILEIAQDREDVKDSSSGPIPNEWMRVATLCRDGIEKAASC